MNKFLDKKGFTLIEMLVVIAMIGLLSSVILVAIGPSREKARNTRIISNVKQIVAIGQTYYDPVSATFNITSFKSNTQVSKLKDDIGAQGGSFDPARDILAASSTARTFLVRAGLVGGSTYCEDSNGNVGSGSQCSDGHVEVGTSTPGD